MENKSKNIELKLENIGYIKEANIDISGLTVIAGKNDEGKSTVGKALMALIKACNMGNNTKNMDTIKKDGIKGFWTILQKSKRYDLLDANRQNLTNSTKKHFNQMINLLFDYEISDRGKIVLEDNKGSYEAIIVNNQCVEFRNIGRESNDFLDCTFIQTPLVWDLEEFFNTIVVMRQNSSIYDDTFEIKYPYVLWDLYTKLTFPALKYKQNINNPIKSNIKNIIGGKFIKEQDKLYRFYNDKGQDISLKDIAVGIKTFGIIQVLLDKNRFTPQGYFIFDEPENHLHPTWQIEFAKVLVALAKNNIRIMINTHSPYMLEALDKYSKKHTSYTKFYLADNGFVQQIDGSNERTLEEIFKKLNEPFKIFDEMENE